MKKKCQIIIAAMCAVLFSGCGYKEYMSVDKAGNVSTEMYAYINDDGEDDVTPVDSLGVEEINGKTYYKYKAEKTKDEKTGATQFQYTYRTSNGVESTESMAGIDKGDEGVVITKDTFEWTRNDEGISLVDFFVLSVTMPSEIVSTNGELSPDKKTVTFDLNDGKYAKQCYAYTNSKSTLEEISLSGLNKYGHVTKAKTIKVNAPGEVEYVKVNGKEQKSKSIKLTKQGKYTVKVKTDRQSKRFVFYYDKTKPTCSVKAKAYKKPVKITYNDKYSGIESVKLDGKSIKSGYKCNKKGSHKLVLQDKAGNKKTIQFKIK